MTSNSQLIEKLRGVIDELSAIDSGEPSNGESPEYLDPQLVKYLFTGMWVTNAIKNSGDGILPGDKLPVCPLCLCNQNGFCADPERT